MRQAVRVTQPDGMKVANPVLVGRSAELRRLAELIDGVSGGGGCLVVSGDPGIGKSALLAEATRLAADGGMRVLRARGLPPEARLPFAGLRWRSLADAWSSIRSCCSSRTGPARSVRWMAGICRCCGSMGLVTPALPNSLTRTPLRWNQARSPLRAARAAFEAHGATAWAEVAQQELRATGTRWRSQAVPMTYIAP
jgi:predicted ATPase